MKAARAWRFIALGLAIACALPAACGTGGVVGGECKPGYCGDNASSGKGGSGGSSSSTAGNSNVGANHPGGAGAGAGNGAASSQAGDGELPDGSIFDSPVDGQADAMAPLECLPPFNTPEHCGDCDTQCPPSAPKCKDNGDETYVCVPKCIAPQVDCQGMCVDPATFFNSDPDNCGQCGKHCPTDICQAGACVGARSGNVVLMCMDFNSATATSSPTAALGNAVFLPRVNPVQVLAYTRGATAAAVNRVNAVIDWAGKPLGRTAVITEAKTVAAVTSKLNIVDYQVLLIHDLDQAKSGAPAAAAATWDAGGVLSSFSKAGGVIIVIDGGDGTGEMNDLINAGKLFDPAGVATITGQTDMTGDQVWNNVPIGIGTDVASPFLGTSHTCSFDTAAKASADTFFVFTDDEAGGNPVAIQRVITP